MFVFTLPRSGSTLLQRVLAAHEGVATASEPWLLWPLLGPLHSAARGPSGPDPGTPEAILDFAATMRGGLTGYEAEIREFALRVYERAAPPGTRFFVDKTPNYLRLMDEIVRVFPGSPIVLLARNPLGVLASFVESFSGGRWSFHDWRAEALFGGWDQLAAGWVRHRSVAHLVRYEDLIAGGESPWRDLAEYIGIDHDPAALERFDSVRLEGRLGDRSPYRALTGEPLTKWRDSIDDPYRQWWAERYLRWIGHERLACLGYDLERLLADLHGTPATRPPRPDDLRVAGASIARDMLKARLGRARASAWRMLLG